MPAGVGGGGWLAFSLETTPGTYQDPTTAGTVWIPILSESLMYREEKYFSPQIRQTAIVSDVASSFYHTEGDIRMEIDPNFIPYIYICSRHTTTKTGTGPYNYKFVPNASGGALVSGSGLTNTASITVFRNGVGFGYAGVVFPRIELTLDNGILVGTFGTLGLSEEEPVALGTPAWVDPKLFSAATHSVYVDASSATPAFATPDLTYNGITVTIDHNGSAQNRITASRQATYISFGETNIEYTTELDFADRTEYDKMVANTQAALKFESLRGGSTYAGATEAHQVVFPRTSYATYDVGLPGMADLIMAAVNGRALNIAGADAYTIQVKSAANITIPT